MKVCDYCNSIVNDDATTCPNCSAAQFSRQCETCGAKYRGATCPACAQREHDARAQAEADREQRAAEAKANTGLGWKTALTLFLPFIGGWFLVNNHVKSGFRIFAIIWCCLMALDVSLVANTESAAARVIAALACLAPVGAYLIRNKDKLLGGNNTLGKVSVGAFGVTLVVALVGGLLTGPAEQGTDTTRDAQSESTVVAPAPIPSSTGSSAQEAEESSSASSSAATSSSSEPAGPTAKDVTLTATSKLLEYSKKQTDPLKIVQPDTVDATITTDDTLDLTKVGTQTVTYTIELGGETATQEVAFTVRDSKAPKISFVNAKPKIDEGETFDALANIEYVKDPVDGALGYLSEAPEPHGAEVGLEEFYDAGWYTIEGAVDSSTPGTHQLLVTACDKHGNKTTRELPVTVRAAQAEASTQSAAAAQHTYIVNKNSGKFHLPGCRDVSKMSEANKLEITATRDEMRQWGYDPCMHCNP